jgi:1,4-dihydroxy-2-naphthoyl-CoA synthase
MHGWELTLALLSYAVMEMSWCFTDARDDPRIGVIILTGKARLLACSSLSAAHALGLQQQLHRETVM